MKWSMKKLRYATFLILALSFNVMAGNQDHTCQGGHNCNGGDGGNQSTNKQNNTQNTKVKVNQDVSIDNTSRSRSSVDIGPTSLSSVTGGSQSTSGATTGDSSADANIVVDASNSDERNAPSAPSTYADHCSQGASASGLGGSGGISSRDVLCDHRLVAGEMHEAWKKMKAECAIPENPACDYEKEAQYYHAYLENMDAMERIVSQTSLTGQISKTAGQLVLPAAIIWLIFLL